VAGLGLGHQLLDVLRRKKVTQVTLVEKSQELAEWILPRLRSAYPNIDWSKLAVEIGDAYKVIPKLTADVCLLDIFPDYGGNSYGAFKLECCFRDAGRPDSIPRIWAWGSAQV
jgi:spermidine synthase